MFDARVKLNPAPSELTISPHSTGYENVICSRPMMYDLLLSKVPSANIHMNSKVVSVNQGNDGVTVQCADGTTYSGDILIGADGAYSTVRQSLYETLEKDGKLPESDKGGLGVPKCICMVGTTRPLDAAQYPGLEDDITHFSTCLGNGKPHSVRHMHPLSVHVISRISKWGAKYMNLLCIK